MGDPTVTIGPPANATDAALIAYLLKRVTRLEERVGWERDDARQRIGNVAESVADLRSETDATAERIEGLTREVATGSVTLELVGLALVGVGSLVAVWPALAGMM